MFEWLLALTAALSTPCAVEESPGPCNWQATQRGNGEGDSFLVLDDLVLYINR